MNAAVEWEWRQLSAETIEAHEGIDGYGAYALGEEVAVVICHQRNDDHEFDPESKPTWEICHTLTQHREGISGYESIDLRDSLEEAQHYINEDKDKMIQMVRDDPA